MIVEGHYTIEALSPAHLDHIFQVLDVISLGAEDL